MGERGHEANQILCVIRPDEFATLLVKYKSNEESATGRETAVERVQEIFFN